MKLIPLDALLAKINKRITDAPISYIGHHRVWAYNDVKDIIDTLEVEEVDLEEEIERVRKTHFINDDFEKATLEGRQITNIAKHFFELGLNTSNLLTWEDIRKIDTLCCKVEMEHIPKEEEHYQEVLKRFKAQKGE